MADQVSDTSALELATELTIAWLGNPNTRTSAEEVPSFLRKMHETVSGLSGTTQDEGQAEAATEYTPAVTARKSLASKDHIISMIDGRPYKTLRRHLATHGLSPAEYRDRYGLKSDYPMVAENYSESRRAMAKKIGLGRKGGRGAADAGAGAGAPEEAPEAQAPAPKPRGRRKTASADTAEA